MKSQIKYLLLLAMLSQCAFSQNAKDSLRDLVKSDKADTLLLLHLNDLAWEYKSIGDYDSCVIIARQALELGKKMAQSEGRTGYLGKTGQASAYNNLRSAYYNRGNYSSAIENALLALKIFEELKDKRGITSIYGNIGLIYWHQRDFAKALAYYERALHMAEETGDKDKQATFLGNIGIVYYDKADYPKALDYYKRSLALKEKMDNKLGIGNTVGNIGLVYNDMSEKASDPHKKDSLARLAEQHYLRALETAYALNEKSSIVGFWSNLGSLYIQQKKFRQSFDLLYKALALSDSIGTTDQAMRTYQQLSFLYEESDIPLPDSVGRKAGTLEQSKLRALYYHRRFIAVRDTLFSQENKDELLKKELNYEFAKKEASVRAVQDKKNALAAYELKKQRIIIALASLVLLLVAGVAFVVARSLRTARRQKQIIERQKLIVEEKQKEILDSIYYARRIQRALITSEKYIARRLNVIR